MAGQQARFRREARAGAQAVLHGEMWFEGSAVREGTDVQKVAAGRRLGEGDIREAATMVGHETAQELTRTDHTPHPARALLSTVSDITVGAAMRPGLATCSPRASLFDVARLMASSGAHAVVVWGDEDTDAEGIWGVVSDSDFIAAATEGVRTAEAAAGVAGARAVRVGMNESLEAAAMLMHANAVTHLVVVSDKKHPIGILSALDVARAAADGRSETP